MFVLNVMLTLIFSNIFNVVLLIHGDMDQFERNKVIASFKKKEVPVLVATDVAGKIQEDEVLNSLR